MPGLFAALPELDEAELVIVMEPTDNEIQAGCLGNLYAQRRLPRRERSLGAALAGRERDRAGARGFAAAAGGRAASSSSRRV